MATKTSKKVVAKTETKTSTAQQKKTEGNGSYDFLVGHFEKPSTLIDAATALAEHSKIDPNVATKKIEAFLENAKLDSTLEVRAGTGKNIGQFVIARVPQGSPAKEAPMKVQKKTEKEKGVTQQSEMIRILSHAAITTEDFEEALKGSSAFHGKTKERIRGAIAWALSKRASEAFTKSGKRLVAQEKGGKKTYHLIASKVA